MCKIKLYCKQTLALSLIYPVHICVSLSVDGVGLVEYFCTHPLYICGFASEEDPDFVPEDVE